MRLCGDFSLTASSECHLLFNNVLWHFPLFEHLLRVSVLFADTLTEATKREVEAGVEDSNLNLETGLRAEVEAT